MLSVPSVNIIFVLSVRSERFSLVKHEKAQRKYSGIIRGAKMKFPLRANISSSGWQSGFQTCFV